MEINKKVNESGIFSNIVVIDNDVVTSMGATELESEEDLIQLAANITGKALQESMEDDSIDVLESMVAALDAAHSTNITLITPDKNDIKRFIEAVVKTAEDGNMSHIKDYVKESGNDVPQDIWDYIYKLTNKQQSMGYLLFILAIVAGLWAKEHI